MDSRQRQELVRDVTRKLASSKAAVKAFAQAMASAEKDRFTLKEAHRLAQNRVTELKKMNERLKRENELLVQQNGSLQDQIHYIETQASQQMADLKVRQDEHQHTIAVLRKQIRSSESSVSLALYQQAVAETRATQTELQETKNHIHQLELKMKEQYNRAMQEKDRVLKEYRGRTAMTQGKETLLNNHRQRVAMQQEEKLRQQGVELSMNEAHRRQQQYHHHHHQQEIAKQCSTKTYEGNPTIRDDENHHGTKRVKRR
jgi:chromosome segregation ATPase